MITGICVYPDGESHVKCTREMLSDRYGTMNPLISNELFIYFLLQIGFPQRLTLGVYFLLITPPQPEAEKMN